MKVVKQTTEYTVYKKRSGRYAVRDANKNWVNEAAKVEVLLAEGLITVAAPQSTDTEAEQTAPDAEVSVEAVEESEPEAAESEPEAAESEPEAAESEPEASESEPEAEVDAEPEVDSEAADIEQKTEK